MSVLRKWITMGCPLYSALLLVENPGRVCEADLLREAPFWDRNVVAAVARLAGRVDASSGASLSENPLEKSPTQLAGAL